MIQIKKIIIQLVSFGLTSCFLLSIQAQASFQLIEKGAEQFALKVTSSKISRQPAKEQLQVFIHRTSSSTLPSMLGNYQYEEQSLVFNPILKFKAGQVYKAIFQQQDTFIFSIPEKKTTITPKLLSIYPSADSLPENLLKIYLFFDTPMAEGQAYANVFIEKKDGSPVGKPFLELQPELWNEDQTRLTLWLDPGRVKRDLGPNQLMGPPLLAGQDYVLHIDPSWESQEGVSMREWNTKSFTTYQADRTTPNTDLWKLDRPLPGTKKPLLLHFEEALDYALLQHCIRVFDAEKKEVFGKIKISKEEKGWSFYPSSPWQEGRYNLQVQARLEDLAANNLNRPFDRDVNTTPLREEEFYWVEFWVEGRK